MSVQASGLLQVRGFQLLDLQQVTALQPAKTSRKMLEHQEKVGAILVALVDAPLRRTALLMFTPH